MTTTLQQIGIYRDNIWAGCGHLSDDGEIIDCSAELGPDPDASEETYGAIERAISDGYGEVRRPDGIYTWAIETPE